MKVAKKQEFKKAYDKIINKPRYRSNENKLQLVGNKK
jgi:hypothetical protein